MRAFCYPGRIEERNGGGYAAQANPACDEEPLRNSIGKDSACGGAAAFGNGQIAARIQMEEESPPIVEGQVCKAMVLHFEAGCRTEVR